MGNNPSKDSKQSAAGSKESRPRDSRRQSIQPFSSGGKANAANPSESITSATAQSISQPAERGLDTLRPSNSPDPSTRNNEKVDGPKRTGSRNSRKDVEIRGKGAGLLGPSLGPSGPMKVPTSDRSARQHDHSQVDTEPALPSAYYGTTSRPPRLPLPIEEETHQPGSPLIPPADIRDGNIDLQDLEDELPRKSSMLSSTTVDDEDLGDELQPAAIDEINKTVPTMVEWRASGEKVYVTGTFANWSKKFRLHRDSHDGKLSTILQLPPGTHHLKFIVDGEMRNSDELPTAVDFTNVLVNYIEVSADDLLKPAQKEEAKKVPPGVYPPMNLPEVDERDYATRPLETPSPDEDEEDITRQNFNSKVPQFLVDVDRDEDSPEYQRAANIIGDTPHPPSLPLFLGKSILNGQTPMKDDGSVLNYPNHTVLNHLATSSIKNGVLATSVTTRYKRKYVTTIMYKPTLDGD